MRAELQEFIQSTFKSVWALELLLLLKRQSAHAWSSEELVRELRSSEPVVAQSLSTLHAAGLIAQEEGGHVRFAPASPDLHGLTDEVERIYAQKPNAVRRAILIAPNEKLHTLAEAFRLRKD